MEESGVAIGRELERKDAEIIHLRATLEASERVKRGYLTMLGERETDEKNFVKRWLHMHNMVAVKWPLMNRILADENCNKIVKYDPENYLFDENT